MTLIHSYSRGQAIADGVLIDVTKTAQEAGFRYPVALTRAVWNENVRVPEAVPWQDENGRLWDILWMLRRGIQKAARRRGWKEDEVRFVVYVQNDERGPRPVELFAHCGPGDDLEPVITVMLPNED